MARGNKFVQVVTAVLRKFSYEGISSQENLKKMIMPFFVKFGEIDSKKFMDDKLGLIIKSF